ncbi:MAG: hypothetical protein mread185_000688 [Mycoplasmataceae bacterium]|nr:MAG: hypothetical protein mread185_000688 [Mycoplasmataceae bacterium]
MLLGTFKVSEAKVMSRSFELKLFTDHYFDIGGQQKIINKIRAFDSNFDRNQLALIPEEGYLELEVSTNNEREIKYQEASVNQKILTLKEAELKIGNRITKREIQEQQIFDWIDNDFNINIDYSEHITNPDEDPEKGTINKSAINFENVFQKIENYVRENPNQFSLSVEKINAKMARGVSRLWWNPLRNSMGDERIPTAAYETTSDETAVSMRKIEAIRINGVNRHLHPNSFSQEQFERLKNLLPNDKSCKEFGCYNNHCRHQASEEEDTRVENGLCGYHRAKQIENFNHINQTIEENINRVRIICLNSNNLTEINQAMADLERIKTNNRQHFDNWLAQELLDELNNKKRSLDESYHSNNLLQDLKNNSIREIRDILSQNPIISSSDLSEINRDWEFQINSVNYQNDVNNIKERILLDIIIKRSERQEAERISINLEIAGRNADQLRKQLEEIEKSQGQQNYADNRFGIDNLKNELAKKINPEEYRQIILNNIRKSLIKYNIKSDDLDSHIEEKWEKLKSEKISDINEINQIEKEIVKNVGEKGTSKKLNLIFNQAEDALKTGENIKEIRSRLNNFVLSTDIYEKNLFSQQEKNIKSLLTKLENYSMQSSDSETSSGRFFSAMLIISFFFLVLVIVLIIKKRKNKDNHNSLKRK